MGLIRRAGKVLRLASGLLANACCCVKYWCVPYRNKCEAIGWVCLHDPQDDPAKYGPYPDRTCNGECPPPPDDCCIDTADCPEAWECQEGECWPPVPYYCCYDTLDPSGQPNGTTFCQKGPCRDEAHTASGPHRTAEDCAAKCRKHGCVDSCDSCPSGFGKSKYCVPSDTGPYLTYDKCVETCDQCSAPCTLVPCAQGHWVRTRGQLWCANIANAGLPPYIRTGGQTGEGGTDFWFETDGLPNRPICVSYVSPTGSPLRVQIRGPEMDGCVETAEVIKRDSGWRGIQSCDCPDVRPALPFVGRPKGIVRWGTQQRHSTWFKVRVFSPCANSQWKIAVNCNTCHDLTEEPCCACTSCARATFRSLDERTAPSQGYLQEAFDTIPGNCAQAACGGPWNIAWKAGYPDALKCTSFWWLNRVYCFSGGPTFVGVSYWRLYTCQDGVLVNRTNEAVATAKLAGGIFGGVGPDYAPVNTASGWALTGGASVAQGFPWSGVDPTGNADCPIAVTAKPLLDPVLVCP